MEVALLLARDHCVSIRLVLLICAHLIATAILKKVILYDCGVTKIGEVKVPVQLAPLSVLL